MDYKIVEREKFQLLTKIQAFRNESTSEEGNTEISDFWEQCGANGTFDILKKHSRNHDIYAVRAPISKEKTHFNYGIGLPYDGRSIPERLRVWDVTPTLWDEHTPMTSQNNPNE